MQNSANFLPFDLLSICTFCTICVADALLLNIFPWTPLTIEVRKVKRNKSISDFSAHNVESELYHPDCVLAFCLYKSWKYKNNVKLG